MSFRKRHISHMAMRLGATAFALTWSSAAATLLVEPSLFAQNNVTAKTEAAHQGDKSNKSQNKQAPANGGKSSAVNPCDSRQAQKVDEAADPTGHKTPDDAREKQEDCAAIQTSQEGARSQGYGGYNDERIEGQTPEVQATNPGHLDKATDQEATKEVSKDSRNSRKSREN